jgi:predicted dehydrogenase
MRSELAGGPMLDLGTYPVAFATEVLGRPDRVMAIGEEAPSGVNGQASIMFSHPGWRAVRSAHHDTQSYTRRRSCLRYEWNAHHSRPLLYARPFHGDRK